MISVGEKVKVDMRKLANNMAEGLGYYNNIFVRPEDRYLDAVVINIRCTPSMLSSTPKYTQRIHLTLSDITTAQFKEKYWYVPMFNGEVAEGFVHDGYVVSFWVLKEELVTTPTTPVDHFKDRIRTLTVAP